MRACDNKGFYRDAAARRAHFAKIPADTDFLITHSPPQVRAAGTLGVLAHWTPRPTTPFTGHVRVCVLPRAFWTPAASAAKSWPRGFRSCRMSSLLAHGHEAGTVFRRTNRRCCGLVSGFINLGTCTTGTAAKSWTGRSEARPSLPSAKQRAKRRALRRLRLLLRAVQ